MKGVKRKAFRAAFPYTLPVLAGFWFIGLAYGIYMNVSGFSFVYPMLMSLTIYGGSLEYVVGTMLLAPFAPIKAFIMSLLIQARHLFYGISMLDKYRDMGAKKLYLMYGICDETFSINSSADIPEDVDRGWFMFFVTLLNQIYWVFSATMGGILGSFIPFNTEGVEFAMTAMFVVIFLEQWLKDKLHLSEFIGVGASVSCLVIFGESSFMIPTMALVLIALALVRRYIEGRREE